MKRSLSLANSNTPKSYRRAYTWNDKVEKNNQDLLTARASALLFTTESKKENDFFGSPVSIYGQKVNSKIMPSDFWSGSMKLKLRQMSDSQNRLKKKIDLKFKRIEQFPVIERKFRRSNTDKSLKINFKVKVCAIKSLEEIIDDCKNEYIGNKKLGNEIKQMEKSIKNDYSLIKRIINKN